MKESHKTYLVSILTVVSIFVLNRITSINCSQINVFNGDSLFQLLQFGLKLLIGIGIWITGFYLSKKVKLGKINRIIYFIILSAISMHSTIQAIWKSQFNGSKHVIESICSKSLDNGMLCEFDGLTYEEYILLIKDTKWIPESPPNAGNINISYYRDDFIGDYSLEIEIQLPDNEVIDTLEYPKWMKITDSNDQGNIFYIIKDKIDK